MATHKRTSNGSQESIKILQENLHTLIQQHNLTEASLSRNTEIPQPTLHKILSGKTCDPRFSTLNALAIYFDKTVDALYLPMTSASLGKKIEAQSIPIISWADCLAGLDFIQPLTTDNWPSWTIMEKNNKPYYALITKPAMEPRFPRGATIFVDPTAKAGDGDLVIVHYPNTQEATLRELSIDGPKAWLYAAKTTDQPEAYHEGIKILGVINQSRFIFETNKQ